MKNNFLMLAAASVKSHKLQIVFYCLFLILSTMLINILAGLVFPLADNIENKIKNHVSNREVIVDFPEYVEQSEIDVAIKQLESIEHVKSVYEMPAKITVRSSEGGESDVFDLSYIHQGGGANIIAGNALDENEKDAALVPRTIKSFDTKEKKIKEIKGESLVGTALTLNDELGNTYNLKVAGVYDSSDPIFGARDIVVPRQSLLEYNEKLKSTGGSLGAAEGKSYIVETDSFKNTEAVLEQAQKTANAYIATSVIDSEMYNTALIVVIAALGFFAVFAAFGMFMFLKTNVSSRTSELALYRALGYRSEHIFGILFYEHFIFGFISIGVGILLTLVLAAAYVNPLLYDLVGNTLMEMQLWASPLILAAVALFFLLTLLLVCKSAVKRSEKIDLTILLGEQRQ